MTAPVTGSVLMTTAPNSSGEVSRPGLRPAVRTRGCAFVEGSDGATGDLDILAAQGLNDFARCRSRPAARLGSIQTRIE